MIKKVFCTMIAMLLCLTIASCGNESSEVDSVSLYSLQTSMLEADKDLPEMTSVSSSNDNAEDLFAFLSDFDYKKVEGFFLAYSSEGLADEIAVVRLKNKSDVSDMLKTLEDHVEGRKNLYASYQPDQVSRVENALIFDKGNYVVLIISKNQNSIKTSFENGISK